MRAVVQRVTSARVEVDGQIVGEIERGLVVFVGIGKDDDDADVAYVGDKVLGLRIFADEQGKMNRALADIDGGLLLVSQFTLFGDTSRGRRPSFTDAMPPERAEKMYDEFVALCRVRCARVETGRFRADMRVVVDNDGPVTLLVDSTARADASRAPGSR
jgi:D-tyrosyl-tRNA(Tyr) deacylase